MSDLLNSLKANDAAAVTKALEGKTEINLFNKNIGDEGAKALATALETNDTITNIDLQYNNIGAEGAKALA
eukprot:CAMPEP_0198255432 /NCGR_PEP_ID=MMETSP1447-20131203/5553_1 /TAXON_ID=420782 /ORGANISM="Chaetoceros dichaeta, Strain CCMP1751" /LENGTH=70 /DNA_ID=CAMNT_0043941797 /DNA_START=105 /DNA_END=313 /DNA_ORIENTATION=+